MTNNLIDNERVDMAFDLIDAAMEEAVNEHRLNYYEILTVITLMETKVKQNNISQYLMETVTKFSKQLNEEDKELR
tara:strand:- start:1443 stop:1670 length:228 start_codon:yes stop_codon:yes gene_type:complete